VKKLLESVDGSSKGSAQGIQWILEKAVSKGGTRRQQDPSGQQPQQGEDPKGEPQKPQPKEKPKGGEDGKDPKDRQKTDTPPPPSEREKPRSPEFESWFAELPPQVRKQYETQDWDSIPPKWRDLLRDWMKKVQDEMEKGR
jgi:hypothetical protein